jgi:hypothetical protein
MESSTEKKRRGRKAKIKTVNVITDPEINTVVEEKIPKKRGRKPKGGKVVNNVQNDNIISNIIPNIILHLKCSRQDIDNCNENNQIDTYQFNNTKNYDFNYLQLSNSVTNNNNISLINSDNIPNPIGDNTSDTTKMIWQKLEKLSTSLHIDNICDKKSACFFCTCDFDNTPIYIPKFQLNNLFHVYGCFCSPECACAYLMNEKNIDSTCRFERYYLLNYIYCKIYDYKKNIKPAPSPFYLLDKYYGTLSIQEYRKLLKSERLLLVVDKPLVRSMPELHDDSDDYLLNAKGIPAAINKYIPQKEFKNVTKNDILNEQFNIK